MERSNVYTMHLVVLLFSSSHLLLTTLETLQNDSVQSSLVILEFYTWLEGKTIYLPIYSISFDIRRWVQVNQYDNDSGFPMGWQAGI